MSKKLQIQMNYQMLAAALHELKTLAVTVDEHGNHLQQIDIRWPEMSRENHLHPVWVAHANLDERIKQLEKKKMKEISNEELLDALSERLK